MMRSLIITILLTLVGSQFLEAQGNTVTGTVRDESGEPLIGATIIIQGTTTGTATDLDGKFQIFATPADKLEIEYVGFKKQVIPVGNKTSFLVDLSSGEDIDEVVIVGYGERNKKTLAGSVVSAKGDDLKKASAGPNVINSLNGLMTGVNVQQSSGLPGAKTSNIIIRVPTTINGSAPLILVDGVERTMDELNQSDIESMTVLKDASATAVFGVKGANGVILITTKKGKEGKAKFSIDAETTWGKPSRLPEFTTTAPGLRIRNESILRQVAANEGIWRHFRSERIIGYYESQQFPELYPDVDWQDVILRDWSRSSRFNIDITGGTKKVKYFGSFGYQNQGDIFNTQDVGQGYEPQLRYERFNLRSNLDFDISKTTQFSIRSSGTMAKRQLVPGITYYYALAGYPGSSTVLQYSDGVYGEPDGEFAWIAAQNPFVELNFWGTNVRNEAILTNDFELKQDLNKLVKGLKFKAIMSYDNSFASNGPSIGDYNQITKRIDPEVLEVYGPNYTPEQAAEFTTYTLPPSSATGGLTYDWVKPEIFSRTNNSIVARAYGQQVFYQAGFDYNRTFIEKKVSGENGASHDVGGVAVFNRQLNIRPNNINEKREDWVGRVTYSYNQFLNAEFNGAYNGGEKFSGSKQVDEGLASESFRFGFFPSFGSSVVLSELKAFKKDSSFLKKYIKLLKVRYSIGVIGDDDIVGASFPYLLDYNLISNQQFVNGTEYANSIYNRWTEGQLPNPNVFWEEVLKQDMAIEMEFFEEQNVALTYNYFQDYRRNIYFRATDRNVPIYYGWAQNTPAGNFGEIRSSGHEIDLTLRKRIKNGRFAGLEVEWSMGYADYFSEFVEADDPDLALDYQKRAGFPVGQNSSIINAGVIQSWDQLYTVTLHRDAYIRNNTLPGDYYHLDFNGSGSVDQNDAAPWGQPTRPANNYRSTFNIKYKGFSFLATFYGVFNVNRTEFWTDYWQNNHSNNLEYVARQWTPDNPENTNRQFRLDQQLNGNAQYNGNHFIRDDSYLRLQSAEIAYTIRPDNNESKRNLVERTKLESFRVYIAGNNLGLWSATIFDKQGQSSTIFPRADAFEGSYPIQRFYRIGLRMTF